jgi:phytoene synthase
MHDLDTLVRRVDEDRWLASRFAPALVRERLIAIYAVNYEIARTAESVSEPALGDIRLEWWRAGLEEIADGVMPRQQPALSELNRTIKAPLHAKLLQAIVAARGKDFEPAPFATWGDLDAYVDGTAGVVLGVCIAQCAAPRAAPEAFVAAAGRAWGYAGLLRAAAQWRARGRSALPTSGTPEEMLARARGYHEEARRFSRELPSEVFPAIGYLAFIPGYLRALRAGSAEYPLLLRQGRIIAASATGSL